MAEPESVPTQTPLVGLKMDSDTALYVGMLEGTVAALCVNEIKYRALLELVFDEGFEATQIGVDAKSLIDLAVSALVKQTGMSSAKARTLVLQRWNTRNQPTAVVPKAVPAEELESLLVSAKDQYKQDSQPTGTVQPGTSMSTRYAEWKARQQASAAELPDEEQPESDAAVGSALK